MMTDQEALQEFKRRMSRAETDKSAVQGRYDDCYRLAMPHRHRQGGTMPGDSFDEIFDSTAIDALADFASDLHNAFTPPFTSEWVKLEPSANLQIDEAQKRQLEDEIADYKAEMWSAIAESNLAAAARECYRDLALGTCAMLIQSEDPTRPIVCTCVPVSDLYLDRGPGGSVDGRFRKFRMRAELIPVMWNGAKMPASMANSTADVEVQEGMWRDWSDRGDEVWKIMLVAGGEVLMSDKYKGDGSCPMIICRWDTDGSTAWGFGPLYYALADIKTLNKTVELVLRNADRAVDPVVTYDDDGVIDVSQGIGAGMWIPRAPGSKLDVLDTGANFNIGFVVKDDLQRAIKRSLFQDRPEQTGKTPPTATQWLDQAQNTARRMGAPAGGLVTDWQFGIIQRFAFLLTARGVAPKVKLSGSDSLVVLRPTSALVRSGEQERGQRIRALATEIAQLFPQQAAVVTDAAEYAAERVVQEGLTGTKVFRTPEQVKEVVQQGMAMAQQAGMMPGGQGGQGQ